MRCYFVLPEKVRSYHMMQVRMTTKGERSNKGTGSIQAEAELLSAIVTFFGRLGLTAKDVGFRVSSRKVSRSLAAFRIASGAKPVATSDMSSMPFENHRTGPDLEYLAA
jgi:hypothetical protein